MDDPEFQTGAVFCLFLHVGTNFAHFNVRESEKLQETVGALVLERHTMSHVPLFVKVGRRWPRLLSEKVKG